LYELDGKGINMNWKEVREYQKKKKRRKK